MKFDDEIVLFAVLALAVAAMLLLIPAPADAEEPYEIESVREETAQADEPPLEIEERYEDEPPFSFWIDPEVPIAVQDAAHYYGKAYHISPQLLMAIAYRESHYDPSVEYEGCIGLMQVYEYWHLDRMERLGVTHDDLYTVDGSMHVAVDYLAELFEGCEDAAEVLMIYNGDSTVEAYRTGGEMSDYAADILEMTRELEARYDQLADN